MKTIIITVGVIIALATAFICWCCCRVAGIADEEAEWEYAEYCAKHEKDHNKEDTKNG